MSGCTLDNWPTGKYGAILADPPWSFRVWSKNTGQGRSAEAHYRTMDLDAIKALPVAELAADRCALFLWATMPMLPEALDVMAAWGFSYRTAGFTWAKQTSTGRKWHFGMGYWTRANCELCLLGVRGQNPERLARNVRQLIVAPVRKHSQKPDEIRDRIEQLVAGPYLELFSRRSGGERWDAWGNEVGELDEAAA